MPRKILEHPFIVFVILAIVFGTGLSVIIGTTTGLGIASQVSGAAILTATGYEGYNTVQTAISIGARGGSPAYMLGLVCCVGLIFREDGLGIFSWFPILTTPFLILSGVFTGVFGFYHMKRLHLADDLISQGFGYTQASRAGAVGGVVVGGGLLLILQVFVGCDYLFSLIRSQPSPQQVSSAA